MNATCPRCGTVSLIGAQIRHVLCKTCRLRFCRECQHWKVDRKQNYCADCGASFTVPPSAMPVSILAAVLYIPLVTVIFVAPFARTWFWQVALVAILLPLGYTAAYLAMFYRRTGLAQATRREAVLLIRRTLTLATVAYIAVTIHDTAAIVIWIAVAIMLVMIGLAIRRADPQVIEELQANRHAWQVILSMSNRDALLMRFPDVRTAGEGRT